MKEKIKKMFITVFRNPLWIIVILLIVVVFMLWDISKRINGIQFQLLDIEDDLRGIYGQIGFQPSIGEIWSNTLEHKLIDIQSEIQQIYNLLRH